MRLVIVYFHEIIFGLFILFPFYVRSSLMFVEVITTIKFEKFHKSTRKQLENLNKRMDTLISEFNNLYSDVEDIKNDIRGINNHLLIP